MDVGEAGSMIRSLLIVLCFSCAVGAARAQPADSPQDVVGRFQERLVEVMKAAEGLSVQERYDRLLPAITEAFHIPLMMRIAVADQWNAASESEKSRLVGAFQRKNVATVATLFSGYSGQRFEITGERPAPQNTVIVETRLVDPGGSDIALDYRALRVDGRWYLIDVIVDGGISEMSVRRSEFRDILRQGGLPALVDTLDRKADELLAAK